MTVMTWDELPEEDRATIEKVAKEHGRTGREVYDLAVEKNSYRYHLGKSTNPFDNYEDWPEKDRRACESLGAEVGLTGRQLHIGIEIRIILLPPSTDKCLKIGQLETIRDGGLEALPEKDRAHVEECSFCQIMVSHVTGTE